MVDIPTDEEMDGLTKTDRLVGRMVYTTILLAMTVVGTWAATRGAAFGGDNHATVSLGTAMATVGCCLLLFRAYNKGTD